MKWVETDKREPTKQEIDARRRMEEQLADMVEPPVPWDETMTEEEYWHYLSKLDEKSYYEAMLEDIMTVSKEAHEQRKREHESLGG